MAMIYFEPCTPPSSFVIITISKCKGIESLLINSRELSTRYLRAVKRGGKSERVTYNMLSHAPNCHPILPEFYLSDLSIQSR